MRTMKGMQFHEKLEKLRQGKEWDQADLARKVGVSQSTVSNWFSGARKPKWEVIASLADAFGVPADFLIRDDLDDPPLGLSAMEREILRAAELVGYETALRRIMAAPDAVAAPNPLAGSVGYSIREPRNDPAPSRSPGRKASG